MEIEGFENYLIYEDGRVYSKSRDKFICARSRSDCVNKYISLTNNGKSSRISLEKLIGKHYSPKGGIIIEGFNKYEIFKDGRVWSNIWFRYLSIHLDMSGYKTCRIIRNDGKSKTKKIHRLIAEAFIPNPENLQFVDHKDRDKTNNNIDNLRWVSRRDNNCNTKIPTNNTSGLKGIFETEYGKWTARYNPEENIQRSKNFNTKEEAIKFRDEMVKIHYNIPE